MGFISRLPKALEKPILSDDPNPEEIIDLLEAPEHDFQKFSTEDGREVYRNESLDIEIVYNPKTENITYKDLDDNTSNLNLYS